MSLDIEQIKVTIFPDGRVDTGNAAAFLGCSVKTLADWRLKGRGPRSWLVGKRRYYQIDELRAFASGDA